MENQFYQEIFYILILACRFLITSLLMREDVIRGNLSGPIRWAGVELLSGGMRTYRG